MNWSAQLAKWMLAAGLFASAAASAQVADLRPDSLAAVDRNRGVLIERIIAQFQPSFAPGQEQAVRETLRSLRADHLLAASLAPSLDGLVAVLKSADTDVAGQPAVQTKHLGDATDDLVYTPIAPCRLFDTRPTQNGAGPLLPGVVRTYSATAPLPQQGGPGGCTAPAGIAVAMIQINLISPPALGLLQGGATGSEPFANALLLYNTGAIYGATIPMPVVVANGRFDLLAQFNGTDVAGDLLGYFMSPAATALDCVQTDNPGGGTGNFANNTQFILNLPACTAGYTRVSHSCTNLTPNNTPLIEAATNFFVDCVWLNQTGATLDKNNYHAGSVCCRVPGH